MELLVNEPSPQFIQLHSSKSFLRTTIALKYAVDEVILCLNRAPYGIWEKSQDHLPQPFHNCWIDGGYTQKMVKKIQSSPTTNVLLSFDTTVSWSIVWIWSLDIKRASPTSLPSAIEPRTVWLGSHRESINSSFAVKGSLKAHLQIRPCPDQTANCDCYQR